MDGATPLVELKGATVRFGAFAALDGVDFRMYPGEVHSLMGENGAGKSTLIKAVTGVLPLSEGTLAIFSPVAGSDTSICGAAAPTHSPLMKQRVFSRDLSLRREVSVMRDSRICYVWARFLAFIRRTTSYSLRPAVIWPFGAPYPCPC